MVLSRGNLFPEIIVNDLISKVKGRSSLAVLSQQTPISFNGNKEFVFSMDNEVDIVAEGGKKSEGGVSVDDVIMMPLKIEYGARVSDEFIYGSEEYKINILKSFNDGYSKKVAKGLDLMAFHGINPRTGQASTIIGDNCFDKKVTQTVVFNEKNPDDNMESAVGLIRGSEGDVTGAAFDSAFATSMAKQTVDGNPNSPRLFPELRWGANPGSVNGLKVDVNATVGKGTKDKAIVGDFSNMFKWGYAKQIPFEVIQYGDPDNAGKDLKGYNQVYLRCETFLGWGILDPNHFAIIKEGEAS